MSSFTQAIFLFVNADDAFSLTYVTFRNKSFTLELSVAWKAN